MQIITVKHSDCKLRSEKWDRHSYVVRYQPHFVSAQMKPTLPPEPAELMTCFISYVGTKIEFAASQKKHLDAVLLKHPDDSVWLSVFCWFIITDFPFNYMENEPMRALKSKMHVHAPSGSETWRPCGTTHLPWPHPEIPDWLLRLALSNDRLLQTTLMKPFGLWLWLSEKPWPPSSPWFTVVYTSGRVGRSLLFQRAWIIEKNKKFSVD